LSSRRASVHLALLAVQLAFASLSIVAKRVMDELSPFALVSIRASAAALLLWGLAVLRRRWRVPRRDVAVLAGLAVLGIAANQLLFIAGLARTTATMALVLGTTIPVFTAGLAIALGRERRSARRLAGIGLGLVGAVVAIGVGDVGGGSLAGDLLIVTNSLSYALYLVLGRGILQRHDSLVVTTWVMTFGAILVVPFGAGAAADAAPGLSAGAWLGIAWIVGAATIGTYALNAWALARAPASLVASYIYVQPVVGAGLAAVFLGERPGWGTFAGGALIAAGIWIVARPPTGTSG
jgi:drug/metabolite transporter (DMT)-like permease